jgi:hypothetical protein
MESEPDHNFSRSVEILGRIIHFLFLVAPGRALGQPSSLWRDAAGPSKLSRAQFAAYCMGYWCVRSLVCPWSADRAERRRLRRFLWRKLRHAFLAWTRGDEAGTPRTAAAAVATVRTVLRETYQAYRDARLKRPRHWIDDRTLKAVTILAIAKHEGWKFRANEWRREDVAQDTFCKFYEYDELVASPEAFVRTIAHRLYLDQPTRQVDEFDDDHGGTAPTADVDLDRAMICFEFQAWKKKYKGEPRGVRIVGLDYIEGHGREKAQRIEFERSYPEYRDELVARIRAEVEAARAGTAPQPTKRATDLLVVFGPGTPLSGPEHDRAVEAAAVESYKENLRTLKARALRAFRKHLVEQGYRAKEVER